MPTNQDTLIRQWHMLRLIPRYPQKETVQVIRSTLAAEGFEVTNRTVQRDLNELSVVFPLLVDDREKPFGWSWQQNAPSFCLPGLTIPESLTLAMAEQHLTALLPGSMMEQLTPYFHAARLRLKAEPKRHRGRSWLDKVRIVPPTQPLIPPKVLYEVHRVISEALLRERQAEIEYHKRGEVKSVEYRIHPLALVQRGSILYVYCRIFDYNDPRILPMHRISAATLLDDTVLYPDGFSLDAAVDEGLLGFGSGKVLTVELLFDEGYGNHLYESPLGKDQQITEIDGGKLKVRATIPDTPQLFWWLLGFGAGVEVLSPPELRSEVAATVKAASKKYKG